MAERRPGPEDDAPPEQAAAPAPEPHAEAPEEVVAEGRPWTERGLWTMKPLRQLVWIALILAVLYAAYVARLVTVPLLLGLGLAWLIEPLVLRFQLRMGHGRAVLLTVTLVMVIVLVPLALLLIASLDEIVALIETVATMVPGLGAPLAGVTDQLDSLALEDAGPMLERLNTQATIDAALNLLGLLTALGTLGFQYLILTPFFMAVWSLHYDQLGPWIRQAIPRSQREESLRILHEMERVVAGFFRGRVVIVFIMIAAYTLGYTLIGVPGAAVLGLVTGLLSIAPYLSMIGWFLSTIVLLAAQIDAADPLPLWYVLLAPAALYWILQWSDDYILTPLIQRTRTGLNAPMIMVAVLSGVILFGFWGIILAVPTAACIRILWRELVWPRWLDRAARG